MAKDTKIITENQKIGINSDFVEEVKKDIKLNESTVGVFSLKSASKWINESSKRPTPNDLWKKLWFEGELCILFAETNTGKTILSVQIADELSRKNNTVLYIDCELSDKQFELRYSVNGKDLYSFPDVFYRAEINPNASIPNGKSFEQYLFESIESALIKTSSKILIVDNITYLRSETENAKNALPLMKQLKALMKKFGLSILCLAHTPKRDSTKPISRNDLQGSKMIINFCDSAFAIGESNTDANLRYIKQIKARNTEIIYDSENIILCQIIKPDNFLQFEFINHGNEYELLKLSDEKQKENLIIAVMEMHSNGKSFREIGKSLNISHMKAKRIIDGKNND